MKLLSEAEYNALTSPPEVVLPIEPFQALIARELVVVVEVDTLGGRTQLTHLGVIAKRLYELGVRP